MIEVHNVSKYYFRDKVLDDVSLTIPEGTQLGLIGPGGAGKSLLVKIITGLVKPDEGYVLVNGKNVHELNEVELSDLRKEIGMLFQNYALFDFLNVEDNIAFPLRRAGQLQESEIRERVDAMLEKVNLPGINQRFPNELSGGMKKRVTFARAVIAEPPIIFYDDPTMGLDPVTSSKIFIMLDEFRRLKNTTSICITHDITGAREICDRWAMLNHGQLVSTGTADEFASSDIPLVRQFWHGTLEE